MKETNTYGLTEEEKKSAEKEILPTFPLSDLEVGQTLKGSFAEDEPKEIEVKSTDGTPKKTLIIKVLDETGIFHTMFLSSKTVKMSCYAIATKHNNKLGGIKFSVTKREYEHEKFGKTISYNFQEIIEENHD